MVDLIPALIPIVSRVRQDVTWKKVGPSTRFQRRTPLTRSALKEHLRGIVARGVCPIAEGESTTRLALLDLDSHHGETEWEGMTFIARKIVQKLEGEGYFPVLFRSTGGKGIHVFLIWEKPQDAYSVREFLRKMIEPLGFKPGTAGVAEGEIEIFPKQNKIEIGDFGSQFILPLAGKSVPIDNVILDMEPTTRESALHIDWQASPPVPVLEMLQGAPVARRRHYNGDLLHLKAALELFTSDTDYNRWIKIGMGLHAETNGSPDGFDVWDEWSSKTGGRYPGREELYKKWMSFSLEKGRIITAGYIKKLAQEKGWQEDYSLDFDDLTQQDLELPFEEREKNRRFRLIRADSYLSRKKVDWLIKNVLPRNSSGMTYGGSGDGKTFAILDMACAVALGIDWNGHKVKRGRVVYVCAEGAGGFITRLQAYIKHYKISDSILGDYLTVIPAAPNFLKKDDVLELAEEINRYNTETDLIIVDTLAQTSTGADENSAKDMNIMLRYVALLRDLTQSASHLIHHAGKDESRGARGSSTLKADCDVQFQVSREGEKRLFWVAKMKDGRDGFGWGFKLETEQIGMDDDGDIVSSCIVKFDTEMVTNKRKLNVRKHGYWEDKVLKAIESMEGPHYNVEAVMDEAVRNAPRDIRKKDRRREFARRGLESLSKNGEVTVRDDKVIVDLDV